jgi:fatty acid desaturase
MSTITLSDALSREELRSLSTPSNWRGLLMLAGDIALVAIAFALSIISLWLVPVSIALLAGRQLAFAIVMHDCAHKSLFRTGLMNEVVGKWIGGAAIDAPFLAYRDYHLKHHKFAGTPDDPDHVLVEGYPVSRDSLRRKFIRDFTGQTFVKELAYSWKDATLTGKLPFLFFQAVLIGALWLAGAVWAMAPWWVARIFVFPAIMRLRNIGEHGVALDRYDPEPRRNTHTTRANWLERLTVAPNHVHYHLEHHIFAAVPPYHLPRLHRTLASRGFYEGFDCVSPGYGTVLKKAVRV